MLRLVLPSMIVTPATAMNHSGKPGSAPIGEQIANECIIRRVGFLGCEDAIAPAVAAS
jgi:hypothetical protein